MRKNYLLIFAALFAALVLVACGTAEPEIVQVTVEVPVETIREVEVVVTEIVEREGETIVQEVVVTATPEPVMAPSMTTDDTTTYNLQTFGDIDTMDPNLAYDTASALLINNVMEGLIYYNRDDATSYVPALALEVPSVENGLISEDGLSYTFNIREGVTYHEGGTLTPSDVAYTFQRGLLQSDPASPQWLFLEPMLGYSNCYDITEGIDPECNLAGDPEGLLATATPEQLIAACETVKSAVVADDAAGTVTFNLVQPWGPFLATVAGTWGKIIDMEWAIEQGTWDGTCETWQDHYAPGSANDPLTPVINGTGPYRLEQWTPGESYTLTAFDGYWRADDQPMWEGGPAGMADIATVNVVIVNEWGTRFASLQAGDAEVVTVPIENRPQVDPFVGEECDWETNECTPTDNPDGQLRAWRNLPSTQRTDAFMVFDIPADSPYIGSGQLDGNGIPTDFFSDINVRRAMSYCFDYDLFIEEVQLGEGVRNNGPIIRDMLGYNEDGPMYEFDLAKCEEELATAWGGVLPETGFRFQIAYNTGNSTRQTIAEIYQANLSTINPAYQVDVVGLPWPTFLNATRASQVPLFISGWLEDIHDPHNWVQPYTVGTYGGRQNLPDDVSAAFNDFATRGVTASDPEAREAVYFELQQYYYDQAPQIILSQATGVRYEQRWVNGWYNNPIDGALFYALSLSGN